MTDKQDPIAHAARLLREAAEELRQAHAYNNSEGWENETDAKAAYDEHLAAAQALEDWEQAVGAGGVQALSAAPAAKKSALRTYPNPIVPLIKPVSEQEKMRALYLASSNLMAYLGRNGAIHSDGHAADAMMDCLNDLDGGGFDETLFAASPTPPAEQTFITPETGNSASAKGAAITSESGTPPAEQLHTDDLAVDCFARALKAKLAAARTKGRGGWDMPECTQQRLSDMLREHVAKGDPRDVANFCMFLWARGEAIAPPAEQQAEPGAVGRTGCTAGTDEECTRRGCATSCPALQAAPKAAPGEPSDYQIRAITTAYEQGVGKGHQAYKSGKEIANLDDSTYSCDLAWQYGYREGKEQAKRAAKAAPQQEAQEPFAWESTTPGYIKYITQARYEKFSPNVQRWYKPYRCSGCAERGAGFDACDMATAAAQGFRRGQAAAKQEG